MKILKEDKNLPDVEGAITIDELAPEGPEEGIDVGVANLILDAITTSTQKLQEYNIMSANIEDEDLQLILNSIMATENETLGKLQSMLKIVSPNAEEIMNGAIAAEETVEESPVEESLHEAFFTDSTKQKSLLKWILDKVPSIDLANDFDENIPHDQLGILINNIVNKHGLSKEAQNNNFGKITSDHNEMSKLNPRMARLFTRESMQQALDEYMTATKGDESDKAETDALNNEYSGPVEYKGYVIKSPNGGQTYKISKGKHVVKSGFNTFIRAKEYINQITESYAEDDLDSLRRLISLRK